MTPLARGQHGHCEEQIILLTACSLLKVTTHKKSSRLPFPPNDRLSERSPRSAQSLLLYVTPRTILFCDLAAAPKSKL